MVTSAQPTGMIVHVQVAAFVSQFGANGIVYERYFVWVVQEICGSQTIIKVDTDRHVPSPHLA